MQITDPSDFQKYYNALVSRDSSFTGVFYAGVKTTGVFCIATCRARKPKFENIEFFTELREALKHGYRPCKICCPTENSFQPPDEVIKALEMAREKTGEKVTDYILLKEGIQPEKVRRWFKQHYGITFQAYQRMIRINTAYTNLQKGETVTSSAFGSGYNSLSGFGYMYKKILGNSPRNNPSSDIILMTRFGTPLGPMYACSTHQGICLLEFTDRRMLETEFRDLEKRLKARIFPGVNEHLKMLERELEEYFAGKRFTFDVKLHTPGSNFQQAVWLALVQIPYGSSVSYHHQAMLLNVPTAIRAVASANGHNRISIVIPCHRVIGKDGSLTGYGGGLERKRWLLDHEKKYRIDI